MKMARLEEIRNGTSVRGIASKLSSAAVHRPNHRLRYLTCYCLASHAMSRDCSLL
jgi:hypothetical protein